MSDTMTKERKRVRMTDEPKTKKRKKIAAPTMRLSERAMLVDLDIGIWSAVKTDKEVGQKAREDHDAATEAGRFTKNLLAKRTMKEVQTAAGKVRKVHYSMTLPWANNGARILKAEAYEEYAREIRLRRAEFDAAVRDFMASYEQAKEGARSLLGKMFHLEEYPTADAVRSKFYIKTDVTPVPEAGDFRAKIGDKEIKTIVKDLERRNAERFEAATLLVYERISEATQRMFERLDTYKVSSGWQRDDGSKTKITDALIGNIKELAEMIPVLNIANDPMLDKLKDQMLKDLCQYDVFALRLDGKARAATAKKAKEIYEKASAFIA